MADLEKQPKTIDESPVESGSDTPAAPAPVNPTPRSITRPLAEYDGTELERTRSNDTQRAFPVYPHRKLGNPSPLGLMSFASTTLMYSLYLLRTRHIEATNVVVGMAMAIGGLTQLLAGMWEFAEGNSLGATGFSCYGGFWLSFAVINWPGTGILESYSGNAANQLNDAMGIFFMVWFILSLLIFFGTFRSSIALASMLGFLTLTFLLLMIGQFQEKVSVMKAAGVFGAITSFISYYIATAALYSPETGYLHLPYSHFDANGGTTFIYQGEEIGATNVPREWGIEEYKDVATINFYAEELQVRTASGVDKPDMSDVMDGINRKARDNARVPMQWDDSPHAGFTNGTPWMRVNDNYKHINAKNQVDDEHSVFSFWKQMIAVRKAHPLLVHGDFVVLAPEDEKIFMYTREHNGKALVVMNFSRDEVTVMLPESLRTAVKLIAGNISHESEAKLEAKAVLQPYEGQVWLLGQ